MTAQNTFVRPNNIYTMTPLWILCYTEYEKTQKTAYNLVYDDICNHKRASILLICQNKSI